MSKFINSRFHATIEKEEPVHLNEQRALEL